MSFEEQRPIGQVFDKATLKDIIKPNTSSVIGGLVGASLFSLPDFVRYKKILDYAKKTGRKVDPEEIKNRKKGILLKALGGALAGYGVGKYRSVGSKFDVNDVQNFDDYVEGKLF